MYSISRICSGNISWFCNRMASTTDRMIHLASETLLRWPKALLYHMPLLCRQWAVLSKACQLFQPKVRNITHIALAILDKSSVLVNHLQRLQQLCRFLETKAGHQDPAQVQAYLTKEGARIAKVADFFAKLIEESPFLLPTTGPSPTQQLKDFIDALKLLTRNLSSRENIYAKPARSEEIRLGEQRIDESRTEGSGAASVLADLDALPSDGTIPVLPAGFLDAEPHAQSGALHSALSVVPPFGLFGQPTTISIAEATQRPISIPTSSGQFSSQFEALHVAIPSSIYQHLCAMLHFILVDVAVGIPRFFFYDLPHYMKQLQLLMGFTVENLKLIAEGSEKVERLLWGTLQLMNQLETIEPLVMGFQSYLQSDEFTALNPQERLKLILDKLEPFVNSTNQDVLVAVMREIGTTIPALTPLILGMNNYIGDKTLFAIFSGLVFGGSIQASSNTPSSVAGTSALPRRPSFAAALSSLGRARATSTAPADVGSAASPSTSKSPADAAAAASPPASSSSTGTVHGTPAANKAAKAANNIVQLVGTALFRMMTPPGAPPQAAASTSMPDQVTGPVPTSVPASPVLAPAPPPSGFDPTSVQTSLPLPPPLSGFDPTSVQTSLPLPPPPSGLNPASVKASLAPATPTS